MTRANKTVRRKNAATNHTRKEGTPTMSENETKQFDKMVDNVNDLPQTLSLTLEQVVVDDDFNVRQGYGDKTPEGQKIDEATATGILADSIERDGQRNAVFVRRLPNGKFFLLAGFRRMRALKLIDKRRKAADSKKPVMVRAEVKDVKSDEDAHFLNVRENTERKSLTPYEIARKAAFMAEKFDFKARRIGDGMGVGEKYVGNLMRIMEKCDPRIIEEWAAEHPQATVNWLTRPGFLNADHDEQWHSWQVDTGAIKEDEEGEEGEGGEEGTATAKDDKDPTKTTTKRASVALLTSALKAVKESGESAAWVDGASTALMFALGKRKKLGDVYDPREAKANANAVKAKGKGKGKGETNAEA